MAEPTATTTPKPAIDVSTGSDAVAPAASKKAIAAAAPLQIALRIVIGIVGLSLPIAFFFMPWENRPSAAEDAVPGAMETIAGYQLAMSNDFDGSMLLFMLPVLGIALSVAAFVGFKYSGQAAIVVALVLIGYSLYVLLQLFVQRTALGLWVVAGGTFAILLLGVIAWMTDRDRKPARNIGGKSS